MPCLLQAQHQERGIALGLFSQDAHARYTPYIDEIKAQHASHISLVTIWYQKDIKSSKLAPRKGYTVDETNLRQTIKTARNRGLEVLLFPIVGIETRATNEWRGRIQPDNWDEWFKSYEHYILRMASIAASESVETLCVGSELLSTEKMRDRWAALILKVRSVYRGRLLYSANWDHFEPVSFWDLVDVVGVTAYYELTRENKPTLQQLQDSWARWQEPLREFAKRVNKPLVLTEVGYPSLDGSNIYPWDETRRVAVDLEEQVLCYQAFVLAWHNIDFVHGVYFWNWFGVGGRNDTDYTPRGKPAAAVIRDWYSASVPGVQPSTEVDHARKN